MDLVERNVLVDMAVEEGDALAKKDGFDGEVEGVDEAVLHKLGVDAGAADDGSGLVAFFDESGNELVGGELSGPDVGELGEQLGLGGVDDVEAVFEGRWKGAEGVAANDDDAGLFGLLEKELFVLFGRPIDEVVVVFGNKAVGSQSGDEKDIHSR